MEIQLVMKNQRCTGKKDQWIARANRLQNSRIVKSVVLCVSILMMSSAFAADVVTGLSLTVASDDTVTVNGTGSSAFPGGVGAAGNFPYANGWGWVSGQIDWDDTNGTPTLRLSSPGIDVLNSNGVANNLGD